MENRICVYCQTSITKYEKKVAPDNWGNYAHYLCWNKHEVEPFLSKDNEV